MQLLEQKVNLAAQLKKPKQRLTAQTRSIAEVHRGIKESGFVSNFAFLLTSSRESWERTAKMSISKITAVLVQEKVISWLQVCCNTRCSLKAIP